MRHRPLLLAAVLSSTLALCAPPDLSGPVPGRISAGYMGAGNQKIVPRMQEAGMNACIVKFGSLEADMSDNLRTLIQSWAALCAGHDQAFMPVFNLFGGHEPNWLKDFNRFVDAKGVDYLRTPCPADEAFWVRAVTPRFLAIAQALRDNPPGAICLDVEMYGADFSGFHAPCYCDSCFARFLRTRGLEAQPLPDPKLRAAALEQGNLAEAYRSEQVAQVLKLAEACREELHAISPATRVGVLHLDWDSPFHHGMALGFGTEQMPAICLTERTYSTGCDAYVDEAKAKFAALGAHVDVLGGIWHSRFPAENLAEQYYHMARSTLGYWIYTMETFERPAYSPLPGSVEDYWQAIADAGAELDKLAADPAYESPLTVRAFQVPMIPLTAHGFMAQDLVPFDPSAEPGDHPRLRRKNTLFLYAKAGEEISFEVCHCQIGSYRGRGQMLLVQPDGSELARGEITVQETGKITAVTAQTGMHGLILSMDRNAGEVVKHSHPYAVDVRGKRTAGFITKVPPLHFLCDGSPGPVVVWFETEGSGEGVHCVVTTDTGQQVYDGPIVRPERLELALPEGTKYIVASFEKLPDSVMEDLQVGVEKGLYPFAATSPAGLLRGK